MEEGKSLVNGIVSTALKVITNPSGFYRDMPKTGGFQHPVIFLIAMMVVSMVIGYIGSLAHLGISPMGGGMMGAGALAGIIIAPIIGLIFSFIAAGILFVIWKVMGSQENYETAYRCAAYSSGIIPVTSVLGFIPYLGSVAVLLWGFYLLIAASIEVHKIKSSLAWTVWGIIAALFIMLSLSAQYAARKFSGEWMEKAKEAEQAAKKMQETLSKMPQGGQMTEEQQKQMEEAMKKMQEEMMKNMPQKQEKE
ncbi:MAG: YIP1 family protein [Nitrospirota bacterium]|nr:YIP1 family protein [Nitrospirota bacterium]